jgi:hypothetical protein
MIRNSIIFRIKLAHIEKFVSIILNNFLGMSNIQLIF